MAVKCTKILHHVVKCFIKLTKHFIVIKWKSMKTKDMATMMIVFRIVERPKEISTKFTTQRQVAFLNINQGVVG